MKQHTIQIATALALLASSAVHAQQAVQWMVADGGNGHWYAFRSQAQIVCWSDAKNRSVGEGGHLVTLTSAAENTWVRDRVVSPNSLGCPEGGPYTGGTCEGRPWGQWYWVTGEPFQFSGFANGEPNSGGGEQYIHYWSFCSGLWWNDTVECGTKCWIIEWEADCNNDGIVDYGQILQGQLADTNTDGIPDTCQCGTIPSLPACCPGDLDHDGEVGGADIGLLLSNWGPCASACLYDLNNDEKVNGGDLGLLLAGWGPCAN